MSTEIEVNNCILSPIFELTKYALAAIDVVSFVLFGTDSPFIVAACLYIAI